jgi:hypothetical protein
MKNFKAFLIILLLIVLIVPSVALAAWWNPFTWNWNIFDWFSKPQSSIVQPNQNTSQNQNPPQNTNTQSPMQNINTSPCGEFSDLSDFILNNIVKPDEQKVTPVSLTSQIVPGYKFFNSFEWRRNASEPFVSYPIMNGNTASYEEEVYTNGSWQPTNTDVLSAVKNDSDTIGKIINSKATSLGLTVDQLNTVSPQSFTTTGECGGTDFINTFGFRSGNDLYSIVLKSEKSSCAPSSGSLVMTCGQAINQYDKFYDALNFKAEASVQDSYDKDYIGISDVSPDNTVYEVNGWRTDPFGPNYYYFDGTTTKLVNTGWGPVQCSTLESLKIGKGMLCQVFSSTAPNIERIVTY